MEKEKFRNTLSILFVTFGITLMLLMSYTLCYVCVTLYSMNYKEDCAAIVFGAVFTGTIIGLFYTILLTWKKFKEKGLLKMK